MTDLTTAARLALDTLTDPRIGTWSYMDGSEIYGDFNTAADALRAALAAPTGLVVESHNERWTGADEDGDPIREVGPITCRPVSEPRQEPAVSLPEWWPVFIRNVCELPDRNSPEDEPAAMIATARELENCALQAIETTCVHASPAREPAGCITAAQADRIIGALDPNDGGHDGVAAFVLGLVAPPARDPLALTDSQIYTVWHRTQFSGEDMTIGDVLEFARAVLAAAGETK